MPRYAPPAVRRRVTTVLVVGLFRVLIPGPVDAQSSPPALLDVPDRAEDLYHLGVEAHRLGEHEAARDLLARAVALDPDVATLRLAWAQALLATGDPQGVLDALAPIEGRFAGAPLGVSAAGRYHRLRGAAALRLGQTEIAIERYEAAVRYQREDVGLRAQLIGLYRVGGRNERVVFHLRALVDLLPDNGELRIELGRALLGLDRWREAERAFRNAIALQPDRLVAWDGLGVALTGQRDFGAAVEAFRNGVRIAPDSAEIFEHLGDAFFEGGAFVEALDAYQRAAELGGRGLDEKIDRSRAASTP